MQNFSQIGEVPWPTLTQILQNMPLKSLAFEENVKKSRSQRSLSQVVALDRKSIQHGIKGRMEIVKGEEPCWLVSKRKVWFDALSEEVKREVYDFWTTQASRPTGNKKDFVSLSYREEPVHRTRKTHTGKVPDRSLFGIPGSTPQYESEAKEV